MEKFFAECLGRTQYRRTLKYYTTGNSEQAEELMQSLYNRENNAIVEYLQHRTSSLFKSTLEGLHGDLPNYRRHILRAIIRNMTHAKNRQDMVDHACNYLGEIAVILRQQLAQYVKEFQFDELQIRDQARQALLVRLSN